MQVSRGQAGHEIRAGDPVRAAVIEWEIVAGPERDVRIVAFVHGQPTRRGRVEFTDADEESGAPLTAARLHTPSRSSTATFAGSAARPTTVSNASSAGGRAPARKRYAGP